MNAIANLRLTSLSEMEYSESTIPANGPLTLHDLPWKTMTPDQNSTTHISHALDVITDLPDKPDLEQALNLMKNKQPLPVMYTFKGPLPPHTIQFVACRLGTAWALVKHVYFGRARGNIQSCMAAFRGHPYVLDITSIKARQKTPIIVQYGLTSLGGEMLTRHRLANPEIPENKKLLSNQDIKEAFAFISEHAPLGNAENQTLEWFWYRSGIQLTYRNDTTLMALTSSEGEPWAIYVSWESGRAQTLNYKLCLHCGDTMEVARGCGALKPSPLRTG